MRSRRRRALLPLRATPHVAWPPFFRPAHAAGCAAGEAARRAMDQGSKGPRGRVHVSRRQSRKPCLPSSRGGSVTTAFRHGSWLDASTINVRRLPRNHGRRRVLHLSASIRCFTFAAAPRPNPKRPVRRPAARAIRRVRRSPFAARCSRDEASCAPPLRTPTCTRGRPTSTFVPIGASSCARFAPSRACSAALAHGRLALARAELRADGLARAPQAAHHGSDRHVEHAGRLLVAQPFDGDQQHRRAQCFRQ